MRNSTNNKPTSPDSHTTSPKSGGQISWTTKRGPVKSALPVIDLGIRRDATKRFALAMRPDRIVVGEVRGAEAFELTRAINAGCGFMCTVHANSGPEALNALVNAALMAGENVTEGVVRRVFSQALDVVVHVDRDDAPRGAGAVRRQVTEITAVVPTLGEEQTFEPIFVRRALGEPLEWTGALPPGLEARVDRALPRGTRVRDLLEPSEMSA